MCQRSYFVQKLGLCIILLAVLCLPGFAADKPIPHQVPPRRSTQMSSGFGVNLPLPREPRLPWTEHWWTRIFDSGVKWVRLGQYENSSDKTSWDWVERTPGVYSVLPEVDEAVRSLLDNGVSIEMQLLYNNALYQGDLATRPKHIDPAPSGVGDNDKPPSPIFTGLDTEENLTAFLNYTRFMVNRYKGRVKAWEFWNEADIGYWQPEATTNEARVSRGRDYGQALCRFADVVHEIDPQAKVVLGGTSHIDAPFSLAAIASCPEKIEVMAYHAYPGYGSNHAPEESDALMDAGLFRESVLHVPGMRRDVEFWDNEWNTIPTWKNSSAKVQAAYVPRYYLQARAQKVEGYFWEFIPGTDGNEGDQFGLLHGETSNAQAFQPRPAFHAFEVTAALFGPTEIDPEPDILLEPPEAYAHGQLRKYAYVDRRTGKRIYAIWLAIPSDPQRVFKAIPVEVAIPKSGIVNPVLIDVTTGKVTPLQWRDKEKSRLTIPLSDEAVAVADASYLDWPETIETPGELTATRSGEAAQLTWNSYGSPTEFEIQRSTDWGGWEPVVKISSAQTKYSEQLISGQHVTYRVRALGSGEPSPWSNPAWVDIVPPN